MAHRAVHLHGSFGLALVLVLAASCAGPNKLAQQSEKAYRSGDVEKAYDKAAKAVRKDPENVKARAALTQAAARLYDIRKSEIHALAASDTVAAADRLEALDRFRDEVSGYRIPLPPDSAFAREERAIRSGAAGIEYAAGRDDLENGRPKRAYDEFTRAHSYDASYRDLDRRIEQAYDEARPRVALVPFANQTDLAVLSKEFSDRAYQEVAWRVTREGFRFTAMLPREEVYAVVPVSLLDRMSRREAVRIARQLGADRVIVGRFFGVRSSTETGDFSETVYRRVADKDEKGAERVRYVPQTIEFVSRNRDLSVGYEYQILDVADGSAVRGNSGTMGTSAHILFTSAQVTGDADDYCLAPPDLRKSDPDRAKRIDADWTERCGGWKLAEILERARKNKDRASYHARYRDEFGPNRSERAVFLGDVPPEEDLARVSFGQVVEPLVRSLREVDREEPRGPAVP